MTSDDTINRIMRRADVLVAGRMRESEARISRDVYIAFSRRRIRRAVIVCAALAVIGVTGATVALAVISARINAAHNASQVALARQTQTILRSLGRQDRLREQQFAAVLRTIRRGQMTNARRIYIIERIIDPNFQTDEHKRIALHFPPTYAQPFPQPTSRWDPWTP